MARKKILLPRGTKIPNHIAVVLDGNRRWARSRGLSASEGHKAGYQAIYELAKASRELGVHTFTAWALSTENWRERPEREVKVIFMLAKKALRLIEEEADKEKVRFVHIGRKDRLPRDIIQKILELEEKTKHHKKHLLNLALDYGGTDEIVRATQKIINDQVPAHKIDEKLFASYLDTAGQPYPYVDLFIRTSGELRTSGLMPFQTYYAEFYWERDHLPDFTPEKLKTAILDYSRRRRRFGGNDEAEHLKFKPEMAAKLELAWWRLQNIPEGEKFTHYAVRHLKEQFGLSTRLATRAAKYMALAVVAGEKDKWPKARLNLKRFYKLVRDEVKLAFEPEIVASLEVKFWQEMQGKNRVEAVGEAEDTARELYAETYRISLFQAAKIAHLRVLASLERNLALAGLGAEHWDRAEEYLQKFYSALKERVA
jgi:undecaprenyl diphosphate synthase